MNQILELLPLATFIYSGVWLSVIDVKTHRLPNRGVVLCIGGLLVSFILASLTNFDLLQWKLMALCTLKLFASFFGIYVASQGQFGLGDVKYAFPIGMIIGWYVPSMWVAEIMLAFAIAAIVSVFLLTIKRLSIRDRLAFGPYMTIAALILISTAF